MRTEVGFDAEFDSDRFFSWIYCQKKGFLKIDRLFQRLFIRLYKQ